MTTAHIAAPAAAATDNHRAALDASAPLEQQIQAVLNDYRPNLYMDGGDVEVLQVDGKGIVHLKMMGACIDCPISLLTMKLGIQRLLKEQFPEEIKGVNAITDVDISALYNRSAG
ncbi:MAG: NifU family protein [Caldilineaceae bacterium]